MTVGELLARISSRELTEWMAFAQVEPFGEAREDMRAALIASTIANTARDKKKRRKPYQPEEFMKALPRFRDEAQGERQTWQDHLRIVTMWNAALGGKDERKK